jgi:hypothetical protein
MAGKHEHPSWWGTFDFSKGRLDMSPLRLDARLDARLKDTAPILSLFRLRGMVQKLMRPLMSVEDVRASANLRMDREALTVGDFVLSAEKGSVLADMRFTDTGKDGVVYAKLGPLTFAIDVQASGASEWKMVSARRWFDAKRAARRGALPS